MVSPVKMEFWRPVLGGFLVLCVLCVGGEESTVSKTHCSFPAIYNFGDSNSDTGGISAAFEPIRYPYGDRFFHKPTGRDSDGRLIVDFVGNLQFNTPISDLISFLTFKKVPIFMDQNMKIRS